MPERWDCWRGVQSALCPGALGRRRRGRAGGRCQSSPGMSFMAATMPTRRHVNRASSAAMATARSAFVASSPRSVPGPPHRAPSTRPLPLGARRTRPREGASRRCRCRRRRCPWRSPARPPRWSGLKQAQRAEYQYGGQRCVRDHNADRDSDRHLQPETGGECIAPALSCARWRRMGSSARHQACGGIDGRRRAGGAARAARAARMGRRRRQQGRAPDREAERASGRVPNGVLRRCRRSRRTCGTFGSFAGGSWAAIDPARSWPEGKEGR